MKEIKYPSVRTFFIANTGDEYSFGVVEVNQCMETGLDNIEVFENESIYIARLKEIGIQKVVEVEA